IFCNPDFVTLLDPAFTLQTTRLFLCNRQLDTSLGPFAFASLDPARFPRLRALELNFNVPTPVDFVVSLAELPSLARLKVTPPTLADLDAFFNAVRGLVRLKALEFFDTLPEGGSRHLIVSAIERLEVIKGLETLNRRWFPLSKAVSWKELEVHNVHLDDFARFGDLGYFDGLETLKLHGGFLAKDPIPSFVGELLAAVEHLPRFRTLVFRESVRLYKYVRSPSYRDDDYGDDEADDDGGGAGSVVRPGGGLVGSGPAKKRPPPARAYFNPTPEAARDLAVAVRRRWRPMMEALCARRRLHGWPRVRVLLDSSGDACMIFS
ncbi:hypothetical protein HK405_007786, partial [Cladochytrium tenue]